MLRATPPPFSSAGCSRCRRRCSNALRSTSTSWSFLTKRSCRLCERSCQRQSQITGRTSAAARAPEFLEIRPAPRQPSRLDARHATVVGGRQTTGQLALAADIVYEANCPARECPSHRGRPWNRVVADAMPFHLSRQLRQPYGFVRLVGSGGNFMTDGNGTAVFTTRLLRDNRKCLGLTGEALTTVLRASSSACAAPSSSTTRPTRRSSTSTCGPNSSARRRSLSPRRRRTTRAPPRSTRRPPASRATTTCCGCASDPRPAGSTRGADDRWRRTSTR